MAEEHLFMHSFTIHSFNQLILSVWCARFSSRQRGTCRIRWSVLPSGSAQSAGETRISITTIKKCERCRVGDIGGYYLWRQLLLELWAYLPFLGVFEQEGTLVSTAATLLFLHGGPLVPRETNGLRFCCCWGSVLGWGGFTFGKTATRNPKRNMIYLDSGNAHKLDVSLGSSHVTEDDSSRFAHFLSARN